MRGWLAAVATALAAGGAAATQILPEDSASTAPPPFAALPSVPDLNWADLPIKLTAQDYLTYTDNVFGVPNGFTLPGGSRGDFYDLILVGANGKYNWERQNFYFNANYGVTRYLTDVQADSSQYSLSAGWNWAFTSRCSGTLTAAIARTPSVLEEEVGFGINNVSSQNYNETAKCLVWGGFSLLANSGVSNVQNSPLANSNAPNSAALNQLLDYNSKYVSAGVGYEWSALDNSQLLYRHTDRENPNNGGVLGAYGLASTVLEDDVSLSYQRYFSQRVDASASAGLTRIALISSSGPGSSTSVAPHYALSVNWRPTAKLALQASLAHTVGPPTILLANDQVSDTASLSATYTLTPKTSLSAAVSVGNATGAFVQRLTSSFSQNSQFFSANIGATYQMTPFVSGQVSYQYSDRKSLGLDTVVNRVIVSMSYAPY